jgi:hypothetical protein
VNLHPGSHHASRREEVLAKRGFVSREELDARVERLRAGGQ